MNRIKELRSEKGIMQSELASYLGVSTSSMSAYETGKVQADIVTYQKMAEYFNVSLDHLLGGPEDPIPKEIPSPFPDVTDRFARLDGVDRARVLAYMDGMLLAEKYCIPQSKRSAG